MHHNHFVAGRDGAHIGWASGECHHDGDDGDGDDDGERTEMVVIVVTVLWYDYGGRNKDEDEFDDDNEANNDDDNNKDNIEIIEKFQHAGKTTFVNVIASGQFNEDMVIMINVI